jgi:hypothetical protein
MRFDFRQTTGRHKKLSNQIGFGEARARRKTTLAGLQLPNVDTPNSHHYAI